MRVTYGIFMTLAATALTAAPLAAQGAPLPLPKPPTHAQQGSAGPATPPPTVVQQRGQRYDRVNAYDRYDGAGSSNAGPRHGRRDAHQLVSYAAQVAVDRRVYANFGQGLVYVPAQCSGQLLQAYGAGSQPYANLNITQPVPGVQSSTAQSIAQHPGNAGAANVTAQVVACWSQAPNGTVTVYRYY